MLKSSLKVLKVCVIHVIHVIHVKHVIHVILLSKKSGIISPVDVEECLNIFIGKKREVGIGLE